MNSNNLKPTHHISSRPYDEMDLDTAINQIRRLEEFNSLRDLMDLRSHIAPSRPGSNEHSNNTKTTIISTSEVDEDEESERETCTSHAYHRCSSSTSSIDRFFDARSEFLQDGDEGEDERPSNPLPPHPSFTIPSPPQIFSPTSQPIQHRQQQHIGTASMPVPRRLYHRTREMLDEARAELSMLRRENARLRGETNDDSDDVDGYDMLLDLKRDVIGQTGREQGNGDKEEGRTPLGGGPLLAQWVVALVATGVVFSIAWM